MAPNAVRETLSPATFRRCVVRLCCGAIAVMAATFLPGIACAGAINVSINTSTLSGSSANLAFDLTDGDSVVSNSGTLTHFLTDGTIGTATLTGGITGTLPGPVMIADSSFFNELLVPLVLGNSITFTIDFTNNFVGGVPDNLSFFLLDATATNSLVATNLLGDALVSVDMNSNPGGVVLAASGTNPRVPVSAIPVSTGTVPEPSYFLLLGCALAAISYGGRYSRRLQRKRS